MDNGVDFHSRDQYLHKVEINLWRGD